MCWSGIKNLMRADKLDLTPFDFYLFPSWKGTLKDTIMDIFIIEKHFLLFGRYMVYFLVNETLKFTIGTLLSIKMLVFRNFRENYCFSKKIILEKVLQTIVPKFSFFIRTTLSKDRALQSLHSKFFFHKFISSKDGFFFLCL